MCGHAVIWIRNFDWSLNQACHSPCPGYCDGAVGLLFCLWMQYKTKTSSTNAKPNSTKTAKFRLEPESGLSFFLSISSLIYKCRNKFNLHCKQPVTSSHTQSCFRRGQGTHNPGLCRPAPRTRQKWTGILIHYTSLICKTTRMHLLSRFQLGISQRAN